MQILFTIIVILVALFLIARRFLVPAASPRPDHLGVTDGQLTPCPDSPNCVSTQADSSDNVHYTEAVPLQGPVQEAHDRLLQYIQSQARTTIVTDENNYIHAEFRSAAWGFVDDFEIYIDEAAGKIHFRSAARLGYGDMGVNRRRVEAVKQAIN